MLETMGMDIIYFGGHGMVNILKIQNNIKVISEKVSIGEMLSLDIRMGLRGKNI